MKQISLKLLIFLLLPFILSETTFPYEIEAENCEGVTKIWTSIYGKTINGEYSGEGFAYLTNTSFYFTVTLSEEGIYQISARLAQILKKEGRTQTISINDMDYKFTVPYYDTWTNFDFGIHKLNKGVNTITFKPKSGYAVYDKIIISKTELPDLSLIDTTLSDPKATIEAQKIQDLLGSIYGKKIISGQQEIYGGGNDYNYELEFDYINGLTGKFPAIRGFDFMHYNTVSGWDDKTIERIIEWVKIRGGIAAACWHIKVPINFENYTIGERLSGKLCTFKTDSNFQTDKCIIEGTKEKTYWDLQIEFLAEQLIKLQNENIPLIFRPLHEAEGNGGINGEGAWFWWGKSGAETYVKIWKYLYNKLTQEYGLHNLIWEQNLYIHTADSIKWYSGEEYVDIIGYDKYNVKNNRHDGKTSGPNLSAETNIFYNLFKFGENKKMVALAENDSIPGVNNLITEKAGWLYFSPWYGDYLFDENINTKSDIKEIYTNDYCVTLEDLPNLIKELENTECTKVKRIYDEKSCTSAPTKKADFKCILRIDGNKKSCIEEKKMCLEIKSEANEDICKNAPTSDTSKKCKFNVEKDECQEYYENDDENIENNEGEKTADIKDDIYTDSNERENSDNNKNEDNTDKKSDNNQNSNDSNYEDNNGEINDKENSEYYYKITLYLFILLLL